MNYLPNEILELVFDYVVFDPFMTLKNLLIINRVCKQWRQVANSDHFWKPLCYKTFYDTNAPIDHKLKMYCDFRHCANKAVRKKTMPIEDWLLFEQKNLCRFFVNEQMAQIYADKYGQWNIPPYYLNYKNVKNRPSIENSSAALRSWTYVTPENVDVVQKYCRNRKHYNLGYKVHKKLLKYKGSYFDYFINNYRKHLQLLQHLNTLERERIDNLMTS